MFTCLWEVHAFVSPTHVGMDRAAAALSPAAAGEPHARGDGPGEESSLWHNVR